MSTSPTPRSPVDNDPDNDLDDGLDDEEATALSMQMGFTGFGKQPGPSKSKNKRKFDAVAPSTGSNSVPLAARAKSKASMQNTDDAANASTELDIGGSQDTANVDTDVLPLTSTHSSTHGSSSAKRLDGSWDLVALRRGIRDANGDIAFYDGEFVKDPWRELLAPFPVPVPGALQ